MKKIIEYIVNVERFFDNEINDIIKDESKLAEKEAQQTIIKYDRIDTGLMLKTVRSEMEIEPLKKRFSIISDQEQKGIYYSSYQEFGTSRGIKGIRFVTNSFENAVKRIMEKLDNIKV